MHQKCLYKIIYFFIFCLFAQIALNILLILHTSEFVYLENKIRILYIK